MSERDYSYREGYEDEEADSFEMARERHSGFWLAWKNNPLWQRIVFVFIPFASWIGSIVFCALFNLPAMDIVRAGVCGGLVLFIILLFVVVQVIIKKVKPL